MKPTVSMVIPNYNGIDYIEECLRAVYAEREVPDRVIVVDNGSADGSRELVKEKFPETELICFPENTGFCGAVNAGIQASDGMKYVILLNNDTRVDPEFTGELVRAMEVRDDVFSCQAKMLRMSDPDKIDDAGDLYCGFGWAFARGKGRPSFMYRRTAEIFASCAGAAIYRKSMLDEIGLFDENHFAYLEDTDIGWRAQIAGYHNLYIPSARVLHVGSAASGSIYNHFKVVNTSRNSIYIISKNMPLLQLIINLPALIFGFAVKAVFFTEKGYGKEYVKGIFNGFVLSIRGKREGRKVLFRMENLDNYVRIQIALWVNMIRRLVN